MDDDNDFAIAIQGCGQVDFIEEMLADFVAMLLEDRHQVHAATLTSGRSRDVSLGMQITDDHREDTPLLQTIEHQLAAECEDDQPASSGDPDTLARHGGTVLSSTPSRQSTSKKHAAEVKRHVCRAETARKESGGVQELTTDASV